MTKKPIQFAALLVGVGLCSQAQALVSPSSSVRYTVEHPATHEVLTWIHEELTLFRNGKEVFILTGPNNYLAADFLGKDIVIFYRSKSCFYAKQIVDKSGRVKAKSCIIRKVNNANMSDNKYAWSDLNTDDYKMINNSKNKAKEKFIKSKILVIEYGFYTNWHRYFLYNSSNCVSGLLEIKDKAKILRSCFLSKRNNLHPSKLYYAQYAKNPFFLKIIGHNMYIGKYQSIKKVYKNVWNNIFYYNNIIFAVDAKTSCMFRFNWRGEKLKSFCFNGLVSDVGEHNSLDNKFLDKGLLNLGWLNSGAAPVSNSYYYDLDAGKVASFSDKDYISIYGVKNNAIIFDESLAGDQMSDRDFATLDDVENMNYLRINIASRDGKIHLTLPTPPRKGCGNSYDAWMEKLLDMHTYSNDEELNNSGDTYTTKSTNKDGKITTETLTDEAREHSGETVKGDYVYARRLDDCGKFTYRFHWIDLKHPGPVILKGWQ